MTKNRALVSRLLAGLLTVMATTGGAAADITKFNEAILARDYKAAATAALVAWPTLDKTSDDIVLIAKEFGFAAYVAQDYANAKVFGEFAVANAPEPDATADTLLAAARIKLGRTPETRAALAGALERRLAAPGFDHISYLAADALLAEDFRTKNWKQARESASLAQRLADSGGPGFIAGRHRFQMLGSVSRYLDETRPEPWLELRNQRYAIAQAIGATEDARLIKDLESAYWTIAAWQGTIGSHIWTKGVLLRGEKMLAEDRARYAALPESTRALLGWTDDDDPCKRKMKITRTPRYPASAYFQGFIGTIFLRVDLDSQGKTSNPRIIAAVPEEHFGEAAMKHSRYLRFSPGENWNASCQMARKDHIIEYSFMIPR